MLNNFSTSKFLLLVIAFLEGSSLMASEIIGSKLMGPYFGNSLFVWTALFTTTLGGLAIGYYLGGIFSAKKNHSKILLILLVISFISFVSMGFLSKVVMSNLIDLPIRMGAFLSSLLYIFPLTVCFGCISPIIIRMLSTEEQNIGKNSGIVYSVSTFGGILMTIVLGFYFIPEFGLQFSIYFTSFLISLAIIFYFLVRSTFNRISIKS